HRHRRRPDQRALARGRAALTRSAHDDRSSCAPSRRSLRPGGTVEPMSEVTPRSSGPMRTESDSMGSIEVPADRYWGAQTQRSLHHFAVGRDHMPPAVIRGMAILKKAAALTNRDLDKMPADRADLIVRAAEEIIDGKLDDEFPLFVWQ